uniref:CSON002390 protein n=1 Tax=Culicoides sonorensis TaxID=179676 RepID=A0A336LIF9_CULSO
MYDKTKSTLISETMYDQDLKDLYGIFQFERSQRGKPILLYDNFRFRKERSVNNIIRWRCVTKNCKAKIFTLVRNNRGNINLWHNGYEYRKKVAFKNTINWCCVQGYRYKQGLPTCKARVITKGNELKITGKAHNHPTPIKTRTRDTLFI